MPDHHDLILARIDAIGPAEVARRVAPEWGLMPDRAAEKLSRYRRHLQGRGGVDMTTAYFLPLLDALRLTLGP